MKAIAILGTAGLLMGACASARADLIDDVTTGVDLNFDLKGMNYTYSGFASGGGTVLDADAAPACVAKPSGTLNFVLTGSQIGLPFNVNFPMTGTKLSATRVRWTSDTNPNITVPVTIGTQTINVLIRRVWGQLTADASDEPLFRDALCNQGYNTRLVDTNSNTDSWINVEAYALGIVLPSFRIDFRARDLDTLQFAGVPRGIVKAEAFSIVEGTPFGGDLTSLHLSDDDKLFVLNDENVPNGTVEYTTTFPGNASIGLKLIVESAGTHPNSSQFVDVFNYTTNAWQNIGFSSLTLADGVQTVTPPGSMSNFIQSGTREMKARTRWIPNEDLEAADGWAEAVDRLVWESAG